METLLRENHPEKLVVFSRDELKQHEMRQMVPDNGSSSVRYFIGDVRDKDRLYRAFQGVDLVIHAAALKQVPACEYNPFEAVQDVIEQECVRCGNRLWCEESCRPVDGQSGETNQSLWCD